VSRRQADTGTALSGDQLRGVETSVGDSLAAASTLERPLGGWIRPASAVPGEGRRVAVSQSGG